MLGTQSCEELDDDLGVLDIAGGSGYNILLSGWEPKRR